MKKKISLLLIVAIIFMLVTVPATAETTGNIEYKVTSSAFSSNGFTITSDFATAMTEGATAVWTLPDTGESNLRLYVQKNSNIKIDISSEGKVTTKNLIAAFDNWYELGCYNFTNGDTVTITDNGKTAVIGSLKTESANPIFLSTADLDQTDIHQFRDWWSSSLKNFDGTKTYHGSGYAKWTVPATASGKTDVYYYLPENKSFVGEGLSDCSVSVTFTDIEENKRTCEVGSAKQTAGWVKVATVEFSGKGGETLEVKSSTNGGTTRLSGFKLVANPNGYASYLIPATSSQMLGSWQDDFIHDESGKYNLYSSDILKSVGTKESAVFKTDDVENGAYYLFARTCDYSDYSTANRIFSISVNGTEYRKRENAIDGDSSKNTRFFGTHQYPGTNTGTASSNTPAWAWEQATYPSGAFMVENGQIEIKLNAKANSARLDAILITQDPFCTLENVKSYADCADAFPSYLAYRDKIAYPESAKQTMTSVSQTLSLKNDKTELNFKLGTLADGTNLVQRELKVQNQVVLEYETGLGFLAVRADSVQKIVDERRYPRFYVDYTVNGEKYNFYSYDIYRSGEPEWLIPSTLEQLALNKIKMTAKGKLADITAIWTLEEGDLEPKVEVTATTNLDGEYSFGFFNDPNEISRANVGYILTPFRWQERRFPEDPRLIPEEFSTTDHTQMTYKANENGQEITLGVAVDLDSIAPYRWTHTVPGYTKKDVLGKEFTIDYTEEQSNFGLGTMGENGGVQPSVFAPLMGTLDSTFSVGDTYTFAYRPLASISTSGDNRGWYDCYAHVVKDLRNVYDYRDNYYASMTDTVFNLLNLMKDDEKSGWDEEMQGHYNIEDTYRVTNSNGLAYLQCYMLTEDQELLMERTLPSIGTQLTRNSTHFNSEFSYESRSEGPINKELTKTQFDLGNSNFEGAYVMTRGQMPILRNIAKSNLMLTSVESGGLGLGNPSDALWYDRATGNVSLSTAIEYADSYIENRSFSAATNYLNDKLFINVSYSPHFQSQLDMYEATGNAVYLDGAVEAARRFLPSLRTTDMPSSKTDMYVADVEQIKNESRIFNKDTWWWKDGQGYRRGATMVDVVDNTNDSNYVKRATAGALESALQVDDTEYPFWVTSRVGLGLEQFTTCYGRNANIFMSTWAGDILRLGYLSDDQLMMDMARNSIVGRFANYPGYYIDSYYLTPGLPNYPIDGFDSTSLYFHHIPVFMAAVQDYLFSNAWVKSEGKVDFPTTRSQGYVWFNTRHYGAEAGVMYDETDMWPWLKEGTLTITGASLYDAQQIDWIGGRKDGRAAFALTNASDVDQTVTIAFNSDMKVKDGSKATVYDKAGNASLVDVTDGAVTITIPAKGIRTIAVSGSGIAAPMYSKVVFENEPNANNLYMGNSAMGLMYKGNTYKSSYEENTWKGYKTETGYDVKAYALSVDPRNYMGYIFVGGRSTEARIDEKGVPAGDGKNGIVKSTLTWHYEGDTEVHTETDTHFPYEFYLPVYDRAKKIVFNVETEFGNGEVKTLAEEHTIEPMAVVLEETVSKNHFEPVSLKDLTQAGGVSAPVTKGRLKFCLGDSNYSEETFGGFDFKADDALTDCYLSGYLEVKDVEATTDVVESGYIIFDKVKIEQSMYNSSKSRTDFTVSQFYLAHIDNCHKYDSDGNYIGEKQGVINVTHGATTAYDWSNLYIVDAKTDGELKIVQDGNQYIVQCDGAKYCFVAIVTYDDNRMTSFTVDKAIVSVNNSKVYTLNENQKLFVWENDLYNGTNLTPLLPAKTIN
ncbi:MAG: hypothetical protein IJE10_07365 [Clostridia bacterium]|nr:hypothetical protein [Clostridia bacterium]